MWQSFICVAMQSGCVVVLVAFAALIVQGSDDDSLTQLAMSVSDEEYLFLTMVY